MELTVREGRPEDAERCGTICYEAFKTIAEQHGFPPDFPSADLASRFLARLLAHPGFFSAVAELEERIVGSNFLDERGAVAGVGPITVDPEVQNRSVGRQLMQHVLDRVEERRLPAVRLVQAAYHGRSLSLYTRLGFVVREPLVAMQGAPLGIEIPAHGVRAATREDVEACCRLCVHVHGHERRRELLDAIEEGVATVVEHAGRVAGYATSIAFFGHAVAESNTALEALIAAAKAFPGPGFLLPARNAELFHWCLERGLRVVQPMTLMSKGLYGEPRGAFLPSILY